MLQQTQVVRVLPKYQDFLARFPGVSALAASTPAQVLRAWKGMGYNRRALYLRSSAQIIVESYGGIFPDSEKELVKLPGVGIYTACALLVFAYKQDIAMVDTNIRQIITHYFFDDTPQKPAVVQKVADQLVPKGKSWEWHQALMDFGALQLKQKRPDPSRRATPFKKSNRFYRGRIMDRLRERAIAESQLITFMCKEYGASKDYILTIIKGLIADGLATKKENILCLPES
jgi:A/G-specific adenine glycosylase